MEFSPVWMIGIASFIGFYLVIQLVSSKQESKKILEQRLESMTPLDQKKNELYKQMTLQGSFTDRVIMPAALKLSETFKNFIPMGKDSWAAKKLIHAGYTHPKYLKMYYGIQLLCMLSFPAIAVFYGVLLLRLPVGLPVLFLILAAGFGGFYIPLLVLSTKAQKRQASIQRSLPDFLELLVICVESGLGLDVAIQKIVQCQKESEDTKPLREEWTRYLSDVEFGNPRREALMGISTRSGNEDLKVLISALLLAYEMGSSVGHTLRVQCDTLRNKRMQRAEETAQKVPVKMVPPIYVFLFPAIFVAIFGPLGMVVIKNISSIMGGPS